VAILYLGTIFNHGPDGFVNPNQITLQTFWVNEEKAKTVNRNQEAMSVALQAAQESIVLMKNENSILPLDKFKYKKILVTGPNANDHTILGDWQGSVSPAAVVTILESIKREAGSSCEVVHAPCGRVRGKVSTRLSKSDIETIDPLIPLLQPVKEGETLDSSMIEYAAKKASECDLAIVAVGGYGLRSNWGGKDLW